MCCEFRMFSLLIVELIRIFEIGGWLQSVEYQSIEQIELARSIQNIKHVEYMETSSIY